MTQEEIRNRIQKKEEELAKTEKLLQKYLDNASREEILVIGEFFKTGDYKLHRPFGYTDAWGKAVALYDGRKTLEKYQKQLEAQVAKDNTMNDIPEVIKKFAKELEDRWNEYDMWKKEEIRKELRNAPEYRNREEYRKFQYDMRQKWGVNYYDFACYTTEDQIKKSNKAAVDSLVLNLVNRTVEIAGTIKDAKGLRLDRDNNGYAIINGIVIGEKGKARVESIDAGGYNIQRYHIRVLVKEVRA